MGRAARLASALSERGVPWPAPLDWRDTVTSTSDLLKEEARAGAREWTALLADAQTRGRGRGDRTWVSPPGGLYLSVLLRPRFEALTLVPLAAGLAVAEVAHEHGVDARLKWPNDVLVRGGKLAGVLAESSSSSVGVDWVVLGIGVNVGVAPTALGPSDSATTSLGLEREGEAPPVEDVAAGILARLRVWYDALQSRPASVVQAWRDRAVPWWGTRVQVRTVQGVEQGILREIDEGGALVLEVDGGDRRRLLSGEVAQVRRIGRDT